MPLADGKNCQVEAGAVVMRNVDDGVATASN